MRASCPSGVARRWGVITGRAPAGADRRTIGALTRLPDGEPHRRISAAPHRDLRGNRLYTLLPGRTGRASALSLYSRRVRHPSRNSSANTLPMQETS
ncbi:hypothetical protein DIE04_03915 [Burkholderia sp. Bp8994]|nr:hypothetical protein DIE04_03915 [Burkholderia sp. Bp8994]RQS33343.1 hypothetical protein DIE05_03950 [Burkholderia sp. Bp8995]RQS41495.1 hypothetical protein DIE01_10995 [Burkholderia sp. Bp8990]RQS50447.1 hypothetical protein DIE00_05180 [Burkholderia sp. Bp8989]RQS62802.1 hypothetical protein DID98_06530 [Burkholderia sp. Bp8984]RQZ40908.1 hypothetical protein DIE16_07260 [Burkholderia sp. Bp9090]